MDLFSRCEELNTTLDRMNQQAVEKDGVPVIRLRDYAHYCDTQTFFHAFTRRLNLTKAESRALFAFCHRDTADLRNRTAPFDPYLVTWRYFQFFSYRTGNLDTPDDCVEKLDPERFAPYRAAREKQWRGDPLTPEETRLLAGTENGILSVLFAEAQKLMRA